MFAFLWKALGRFLSLWMTLPEDRKKETFEAVMSFLEGVLRDYYRSQKEKQEGKTA